MIRLCTGEVYTINADDYNDDELISWFSDNHENALIQLIDSNGTYAGMITYSANPKSSDRQLENALIVFR